MARGTTYVEIVTAPIDATSVQAAFAELTTNPKAGMSGSYFAVAFNDDRAIALCGLDQR